MIKICTLSAVAADGQDTSIEVLISDGSLREWLLQVRSCIVTENFMFCWAKTPRATVFPFRGMFAVLYRPDGIYIEERLFFEEYYRDALYPLDDFCRMLRMPYKCIRPSLGWCVTVKV